MGAKAWTLILGLKPHLLMRMHPRMSKRLGRSQNRWSRQERVEGRGPRGSSSSDLTNISQAGIRLTWVIFQEIPTMKIDFRRVRRWQWYRNIFGKSCHHRIKCTVAAFLAALMWRRPLNSVFNHYRSQRVREDAR